MSSCRSKCRPRAAIEKPVYISLSAKITVSFRPHLRKLALISLEISFFFSALLSMLVKGRPGRQDFRQQARPTTVS
jgi:hypothetical protein